MGSVSRLKPAERGKAARANVFSAALRAVSQWCARLICGLQGHLILLHFEPNKLSLQCGVCGYESPGWEVGRPPAVRRAVHTRVQPVRTDSRRSLRAVPSSARMAS